MAHFGRRQARFRLLAVSLSMVLSVSSACSRSRVSEGPAKNLILISIDTLRADRPGAYGYPRPTSPSIDALARRGARFDVAIAESNWTLPSHVSLFTGLPPFEHGVDRPALRLAAHVPTLPEILQQQGFRTLGVTGGAFLSRRYGFERGFDFFRDEALSFEDALRVAADRIGAIPDEERFFAFVHTYDVHCPYDPPEEYTRRFKTEGAEWIETRGRCGSPHFNEIELTQGQRTFLSDRYDAGIRHADDLLGQFLNGLEASRRLADTLVVLVSDHGEELSEHGRIGHQETVYIESLRIPWIIVGSGVKPTTISRPVGLADVLPTVLALLGVEDATRHPRLLSELRGEGAPVEAEPQMSLNTWKGTLVSVVDGDYHAVYKKKAQEYELFDWRVDPGEQLNLAGRDPARDLELQNRMIGPVLMRRQPGRAAFEAIELPSQGDIERLRALGYTD